LRKNGNSSKSWSGDVRKAKNGSQPAKQSGRQTKANKQSFPLETGNGV